MPHLVPLSFDWDGEAVVLATLRDSVTAKNLTATRSVRFGLGHTRDVTMIEGDVDVLAIEELPREQAERFAERTGFDPRSEPEPYLWFRVTPRRIQAWREANEIPGRALMKEGRWLP